MEFTKLSAPSMKELFVQQLESMILSGKLAVGDKLPPEREIAKSMQISRGIVNSGILELSRKGFLTIKPRVGTFVADYRRTGTLETLLSILNYHEGALLQEEIRSILEIRIALCSLSLKLAIPLMKQEDFDLLRRHTDEIAKLPTHRQAAEKAFDFYHELAVLSGNMLMPLIFYSFKEAVIILWERFCHLHGREKLYTNTDTLCKYIEQRDLKGALRWSAESIQDVIVGNDQIYY